MKSNSDTNFTELKKDSDNTIYTKTKDADFPPFSVAMCVYEKDNAEWFDSALGSVIIKQTVKPSEVVLVVDGPVSDSIHAVIKKYEKICDGRRIFKVNEFTENRGLGEALKVGIKNCTYELIARMDSDDIAVENRFELQLRKMADQTVDICGGQIEEFIGDINNTAGRRLVPETDSELKSYMKKRCPFNHMTVMYKKTAVLEAGNYMDWFWNEDYYLWIRMALAHMTFANLPEVLVHVRVGKDMYARRGGKKYFVSETRLQKYMLDKKMISFPTYVGNIGKRAIMQILLPNKIRARVFKHFARN